MLQNLRYFSFRRFGQIQKRIIHNKNHLEDEAHQHSLLMQQYQLKILDSQQVLVVQPWFHASSPRARHDTTEELMLQESLGLVKTLGWTVVDKLIVTIQEDKGRFLGTGQLERLSEIIAKLENKTFVSAVFLSTYKLGTKQRILAEEIIGKSVIDRYSVILQIFAKHAQSKEAKLQVQLAEIPYLKSRLISDLDFENDSKHSKSRKGKNWFDKQRLNLNNREKKLKLAIDKIKDQRKLLRSNRIRNKIPSIAVIGYTNSGKTSLIKALTSEEKLEPKNELFATLDVTAHSLVMPSNLETFMIDTVGFISDIPISLIASFNATLEDAKLADILIHVRDVSNPDHFAQNQNVLKTLGGLEISRKLMKNMITVGNKCDKLSEDDLENVRKDGMIPISTKTGLNMQELMVKLDTVLLKETGLLQKRFKVLTGSQEFQEIMRNVNVTNIKACPEDENFSLIDTLLPEYELKKFEKWLQ